MALWTSPSRSICQRYYRYGDVKTYAIVSRDCEADPLGHRNHFLLMHEDWEGKKRVHGMVVHAEIRDGKIWMHHDGIEESITEELVAAGVPKDCIVLAFHPPFGVTSNSISSFCPASTYKF